MEDAGLLSRFLSQAKFFLIYHWRNSLSTFKREEPNNVTVTEFDANLRFQFVGSSVSFPFQFVESEHQSNNRNTIQICGERQQGRRDRRVHGEYYVGSEDCKG